MSRGRCLKCGDTIIAQGDRFRLKAYDMADSSAAWYSGRLCRGCWQELVEFIKTEPRWASA